MRDNTNDNYVHKVIFIINNISSDPLSYSNIIKDPIKNIKRNKTNKLIYYDKVKVASFKGEKAFYEAGEKFKNMQPMDVLKFDLIFVYPYLKMMMSLCQKNFLLTT